MLLLLFMSTLIMFTGARLNWVSARKRACLQELGVFFWHRGPPPYFHGGRLLLGKAVSPSFFVLPSPSSMTSTAHTCRLHTPHHRHFDPM